MPSPGAESIKSSLLETSYTLEQTVAGETRTLTCQFADDAPVIDKLSAAMDTGWTSASPSASTTMAAAITSEFSYLSGAPGLPFLVAIGTGIDTEVAKWVASWNPQSGIHTYAPQASAAFAVFVSSTSQRLVSMDALADTAINAFFDDFDQATG